MVLRVELISDLRESDEDAWNALTGADDPFNRWGLLQALEESGSVGDQSGWSPLHVLVFEDEALLAAMPLYVKMHSYGEYIFDFSWAGGAQGAGIEYYPKLVSMAPFTPATGRRFLLADEGRRKELIDALLQGARAAADAVGASSIHLLFLSEAEQADACALGYHGQTTHQFHFHNPGYQTIDDYLAAFRSSKRKAIRKERREVRLSGLEIRELSGPELDDAQWSLLDRYYRDNCRRHGSFPYLSERFFETLRHRPEAQSLVAFMAYRGQQPLAAAICFERGENLFGRYWGASEEAAFLHFELCYYRPIERAIRLGHSRFEAGAQGHHKLRRGLLPSRVYSAHWLRDPRLDMAVSQALLQDNGMVEREIALLMERSPLRREGR